MKYGIDTRCQHLADDNKDEIYGASCIKVNQIELCIKRKISVTEGVLPDR